MLNRVVSKILKIRHSQVDATHQLQYSNNDQNEITPKIIHSKQLRSSMYESVPLRSKFDNPLVKNPVENVLDDKAEESINFEAISDFKNVSLIITKYV